MIRPPRVRLTPVAAAETGEIARRLIAAGLPADDLAEPDKKFYRAVAADRTPVGQIGWEIYGEHALLRSLVVDPGCRRQGHGRDIVAAAERRLAEAEVRHVWLLTVTAAPVFDRLGYTRIARTAAPPAVQATSEFTGACPASALCFTRLLRGGGP